MSTVDEMEQIWASICARYKPGHIEIAGIILTQLIGFILPATIYLLIDILFPNFSRKHKLQSAQRQPTGAQIRHCIKISLFNQLWVAILHAATVQFLVGPDHSLLDMSPTLPTPSTLIKDFLFGLAAREITFYYVHRALHHPSIYAHIHKMHHRYTAPISFAAEYAHPVEHILANVLPVALPLTLKGAHFLSLSGFMLFELWQAAADHSGYDIWKLPPAQIHDLHHEKFRVYYSPLGVMDWVHGTDVVGWDRVPGKRSGKGGVKGE